MEQSQESERTVRRWFGYSFTRGGLSGICDEVGGDFVAHGPGDHPGSRGIAAFKAWLRSYRTSFTDPEWPEGKAQRR